MVVGAFGRVPAVVSAQGNTRGQHPQHDLGRLPASSIPCYWHYGGLEQPGSKNTRTATNCAGGRLHLQHVAVQPPAPLIASLFSRDSAGLKNSR